MFASVSRIWRGRKIWVIDTPDIASSKDIKTELQRHAPQGLHAFLLVTPLGSFTKMDEAVLDTIRSIFGEKFIDYMIVLLTRKEDLGDQDLEMFLKSNNEALYQLIKKCKDRYSAFNYRVTGAEEQCQVDELLQKIVDLVVQNRAKPCVISQEGTYCVKHILYMLLTARCDMCKSFLFSEGQREAKKDRSRLLTSFSLSPSFLKCS